MASLNRVSEQWNHWKELEKEIAGQFNGGLEDSRSFLLRKLSHLERMEVRFAGTTSINEQLTLVAIKDVRRKLERKLFPSRIVRLFRKGVKRLLDMRYEARLRERSQQSIEHIKDTLARSGFPKVAAKVDQCLQLGKLAIPFSEYPGQSDRVNLEFKIRQEDAGGYTLDGYQATLYPVGKKEGMKSQFFPASDHELLPSWERAYHLLSGRAVLKAPDALSEHRARKWMQLDFNDKDAQGNYRVREFPEFDLDTQLNGLKLSRDVDPLAVKIDLQNGREVHVVSKLDNQNQSVLLSVRPQRGIIIPLDGEGRDVSAGHSQGSLERKLAAALPDQQQAQTVKEAVVRKLKR